MCILSGVPLEILALEHWVPGLTSRQEAPKFKNQKQFQEILTTTDVSATLYILRATKDRLKSQETARIDDWKTIVLHIQWHTWRLITNPHPCRISQGRHPKMPQSRPRTARMGFGWGCSHVNLTGCLYFPHMSQILIIHLCQKNAQLSEDEHILLHDICCCWIWLREKLAQSFPTAVVEKYDGLFEKGFFGLGL